MGTYKSDAIREYEADNWIIMKAEEIADKTKEDYETNAKSIIRRFCKDRNIAICLGKDLNAEEFVTWLKDGKALQASSTFRYHKSSLVHYLSKHGNPGLSDEVKKITSRGCKPKGMLKQTSSKKQKYIRQTQHEKISTHLHNLSNSSDNPIYRILYCCYSSIYIIGMRPQELNGFSVIDTGGKLICKIANAKNTQGRSFGPFRHPDISNLADEDILILRLTSQFCSDDYITNTLAPQGVADSWAKLYKKLRDTFRRAIIDLDFKGKKSIALRLVIPNDKEVTLVKDMFTTFTPGKKVSPTLNR